MSHVFHRELTCDYPTAVSGDGMYLVDSTGKRYIDASGGAAVSCLGHNHPAVVEAMTEQAAQLSFAHSAFFTSRPMEDLADLLADKAPGNLNHVYFVSGGSEAVEASVKMARQYFLEKGQPQRSRVISRLQSYHGNTLGALAIGANMWRRRKFEPLLIEVGHIPPCYAYRDRREGESEEAYGLRVADELEAKIQELGPETVMAFVAETVVGATMGAVPPAPGYFKRIREICDRHGVLLILDEVMCGMGRTGTTFAFEQDGIVPDIVALAKGVAGGYQPLGAVIASSTLYDAFKGGSGSFHHGHTYMGHTLACAAGLAVQRTIDRDNLLVNVRERGEEFRSLLKDRFGSHANVGDIRGRGLFLGLELVADRDTKEPFDPDLKIHAKIKAAAMAEGMICYPMGGTIDGRVGDHILLAPPYIVTSGDLKTITERLDKALKGALP